MGQRRIIVGVEMTDCLVLSSSESDVLADCCRRHSQRKKERVKEREEGDNGNVGKEKRLSAGKKDERE